MESHDNNGIKKFKCSQCKKYKDYLIWKNIKIQPGYICEECWKIYNKRMKSVFHCK